MREVPPSLAHVLTEYVSPFQAQSSACSLQAELEKLRLAENAAASDMEEVQHLKVIGLPWSLMVGVEQDNKSRVQARLRAWFNHS